MARRTKTSNSVVTQLVTEALRLATEKSKDPQAAKSVKVAADKASQTAKKLRASQDAELRKALRAAGSLKPEALDRAFLMVARARAESGCGGAECAFACSIGCGAGCLITGGLTVAFGALGGTAGGSGTAIATSLSATAAL